MRALVVDDDASLRGVVRDLFREVGYSCVSFASHSDTFARAATDGGCPDLIVLDLQPAEASRVRRRIAPEFPHVPVVTIGDSDYEPILEALLEVQSAARRRCRDRERQQSARVRRLERSNDELKRLACIDAMTGIANRKHFDSLLAAEWLRCAHRGWPLSVVMLDLDFFHAFNEQYGHPGGDVCLRRIADALIRCLRRPSDIVARYGGEEFVALLPDTNDDGARVAAERLRRRIEQLGLPHPGSPCAPVVTASAGVATTFPTRSQNGRALIVAADRALLRAKELGRNRIGVDGSHAGRIEVRPPNRQPGPIVIAHPIVADRLPGFLAAKRDEVASLCAHADLASTAAASRDLQRSGKKLGIGPLVALGERLEQAVEDGATERVRAVLDDVARYLDHVQVVYRQGTGPASETLDEVRKLDDKVECS